MTCTGSVELESTLPESKSSHAQAGTEAHTYNEDHLFDWQISPTVDEKYSGFLIWREHLYSIMQTSKDFRLMIEKKISLDFIDADLFGTVDCILEDHTNSTLHIIDYKFGVTKVEPDCEQLKYYAVGACYQKPFEKIVFTIVQPRLQAKTIAKVRSYETNKDELKEFALKLQMIVNKIKLGKTKLEASSACYFCRAKEICPEYRKKYLINAKDEFSPITTKES
jgi:hypothetical protein